MTNEKVEYQNKLYTASQLKEKLQQVSIIGEAFMNYTSLVVREQEVSEEQMYNIEACYYNAIHGIFA